MSNESLKGKLEEAAKPPAERGKSRNFLNMLEEMKPQFAAALPRHITPDRMVRVALTCYRMTPALKECTPESVMGAVVQCAQLGLEPGLLGQAYLVPFKRNKKDADGNWRSWKECTFIPGYKGLIALARRSGDVSSITTEIVYERDTFEMQLGIEPFVKHEPFLDGDRGKIRLVYGVAQFKDGGRHFEWMSYPDVLKIRARSQAKDSGPWVTDHEQMVRKTLIRRMANYLPMSVELAGAVQASDAVDKGHSLTIDMAPDGQITGIIEHDENGEVIEGDQPEEASAGKSPEKPKADPQPDPNAGKGDEKAAPEKSGSSSGERAEPHPSDNDEPPPGVGRVVEPVDPKAGKPAGGPRRPRGPMSVS